MNFEFPAELIAYSDLQPGDVFEYSREGVQYGIMTKANDNQALVSFTEKLGAAVPCIQPDGDLETSSVLVFRNATMRPIWPQASNPTAEVGTLIVTRNGKFIRVMGTSGKYDIDISNGASLLARNHSKSLVLTTWEIGVGSGSDFRPLVKFPMDKISRQELLV